VLELFLTGRYLPIVIDNGHNSKSTAVRRVEEIAREELKFVPPFPLLGPTAVSAEGVRVDANPPSVLVISFPRASFAFSSSPVLRLCRAFNRDDNLPSIDLHECDLTDAKAINDVFESYEGKGGIWGLIHVAVRPPSFSSSVRL
jgi:hypothetical protein